LGGAAKPEVGTKRSLVSSGHFPAMDHSLSAAILHQMDTGILLLDRNKNILAINKWFYDHCDLPDKPLAGKNFLDIFPGQKNSQLDKSIHAALKHRIRSILSPDMNLSPLPLFIREDSPEKGSKEHKTKNSETGKRPFSHTITVKPAKGPMNAPQCLIQVTRLSPTTLREALLYEQTRKMMEVAENLRLTKEMAERANRAKSEFLALTSHELRTPLNAIIGFADILSDELLGPHQIAQYKEYSQDIRDAGQHLLNVINDILDLSKIEANKFELNEEHVDVVEIIRSVANMVSRNLKQSGLALICDYPDDLPDLTADRRSLKQMLLNLVSNSIKFTPDGGKIHICAALTDRGEMEVSVRDSGVGIAREDIEHILEPFTQASSHLNRKTEGTGLGLTLVKKMIELHGGRLILESEIGRGTYVALIFPQNRIHHL
tara:strand:- start:2421 stop:3716 length:1296 start_codon:yes stop_codon:yes gene_type:complete